MRQRASKECSCWWALFVVFFSFWSFRAGDRFFNFQYFFVAFQYACQASDIGRDITGPSSSLFGTSS